MRFTGYDSQFRERAINTHLTAVRSSGFVVAFAYLDVACGTAVGDDFDFDLAVAVESKEGRGAPGAGVGG